MPRMLPKSSWAFARSAPSATIIRSIAGRWMTTTASRRSFAKPVRKDAEDYREQIIFDARGGEVNHPVNGQVMAPKFLGGDLADTKGKDRRVVMAEWLTSPENPYFATSIANRVWAHFMGVGIVEPVDDIRVSNPPSNPELFQTLGAKLAEYKFDFRQLVRDICNSQAYQRTATPNDSNRGDTRNYAYATVRRIPSEMLLDCVSPSDQHERKVSRSAARCPCGSNRRRWNQHLFPDDIRTRPAGHGVRMRSLDRSVTLPSTASAQRQRHLRKNRPRQSCRGIAGR